MMKVQHKGYRIWAILQATGSYRAYFIKPPVAVDAKPDASPIIEGETQADAIDRAREFIDGLTELNRAPTNVIAGRWAV
jgi:hypothetical protein